MPTVTFKQGHRRTFITFAGEYKPGDPAPSGYLEWHEWAKAQSKGGLFQRRRQCCGRWKFPQEVCSHNPPDTTVHKE